LVSPQGLPTQLPSHERRRARQKKLQASRFSTVACSSDADASQSTKSKRCQQRCQQRCSSLLGLFGRVKISNCASAINNSGDSLAADTSIRPRSPAARSSPKIVNPPILAGRGSRRQCRIACVQEEPVRVTGHQDRSRWRRDGARFRLRGMPGQTLLPRTLGEEFGVIPPNMPFQLGTASRQAKA
jgi:hypothetical protein